MEKKIKILIGIILIIFTITLIVFIYLRSIMTKVNEDGTVGKDHIISEQQDPNNPGVTVKEEYNIQKVRNAGRFFTVQNCIQDYIKYAKEGNKQAVLDILDSEYMSKNNISTGDLSSLTEKYKGEDFVAKKMEMLDGKVLGQHRVYGYISNNGEKQYFYFKVNLDLNNRTYTILPCEGSEYKSLEFIELKEDNTSIAKNDNNQFTFEEINKEEICRRYQRYYSNLELNDPKEAYGLLDQEYTEKRFESFDDFKRYLELNKEAIEEGALAGYNVDYGETTTKYTIKTSYDMYYLLEEDSIMNFTIKLDPYSVPNEEFENNYKNLKEAEKTSANIGLFFQMINTKDYKHAYEKLSDGFKNNYFKTQEDFEKYVSTNWYYTNKYNIDNYRNEGNIYIYQISLSNYKSSRENTTISKIFNIRLNESNDMDYEISFNVD